MPFAQQPAILVVVYVRLFLDRQIGAVIKAVLNNFTFDSYEIKSRFAHKAKS